MTSKSKQRLEMFISLAWYEVLLRFIANFIAKTSELLLAAGLVVSTANFLTDGSILKTHDNLSVAWAWAQALAIDSSLGISFYSILQCLKQRDWTKCVLYSILTALLALVAGTITNIDIFSHAIHTSMGDAMTKIGLDIQVLSALRSVAVVGFVLMSRLRDVSFKDLYASAEVEQPREPETSLVKSPQEHHILSAESHLFTFQEVALLMQAVSQKGETRVTEAPKEASLPQVAHHSRVTGQDQQSNAPHDTQKVVPETLLPGTSLQQHRTAPSAVAPEPVQDTRTAPKQSGTTLTPVEPQIQQELPRHASEEPEVEPQIQQQEISAPQKSPDRGLDTALALQEDGMQEREERLEQAYQALSAEGKKISARALAERAHIHRTTCHRWLQNRKQHGVSE